MNSISGSNDYLLKLINKFQTSDNELAYIQDGFYFNKLFNISFKIPNEWHIVSVSTFNKKIKEQKFQGLFEIAKENLLTYFDTPSCLVTKYDPESNDHDGIVTPTINFNIIPPGPNSDLMTLEDHADSLDINPEVQPYHFLKEFKIKKKSFLNPINGNKAIKIETEYLLESNELEKPVKVEMDVIFIEYGEFILDFSMTQCQVQNQIANKEFIEVLESIKLNNNG
jgi:hypothetical protein